MACSPSIFSKRLPTKAHAGLVIIGVNLQYSVLLDSCQILIIPSKCFFHCRRSPPSRRRFDECRALMGFGRFRDWSPTQSVLIWKVDGKSVCSEQKVSLLWSPFFDAFFRSEPLSESYHYYWHPQKFHHIHPGLEEIGALSMWQYLLILYVVPLLAPPHCSNSQGQGSA